MKMLSKVLLGATLSFNLPQLAIAQSESNQTLALTNVAGGKPTSQISAILGGISSHAVDGGLNGVYDGGSVTHTDTAVGAWWEVDLQASTPIQRITVYNRTDCCTERLSNFVVQILDADRALVKQFVTNRTAPAISDYYAGGSRGRFVRVQLNGENVLSLAEVQVWADPAALQQ